MSIDSEFESDYHRTVLSKEWNEKIRFKGISQEELDRIAKQDKEIAESQAEVDEQVKKAVEENPGQVFDKEAIEKVEKQKAEKLKKIYSG